VTGVAYYYLLYSCVNAVLNFKEDGFVQVQRKLFAV